MKSWSGEQPECRGMVPCWKVQKFLPYCHKKGVGTVRMCAGRSGKSSCLKSFRVSVKYKIRPSAERGLGSMSWMWRRDWQSRQRKCKVKLPSNIEDTSSIKLVIPEDYRERKWSCWYGCCAGKCGVITTQRMILGWGAWLTAYGEFQFFMCSQQV